MDIEQKITDKAAQESISSASKDHKDDFDTNMKMLKGDHWLDGQGWKGALPSDASERQKAVTKINAQFTSQNVMGEITARHVSGVLGKDPEWYFVPSRAMDESEQPNEKENTLIRETETSMLQWWKDQKAHKALINHLIYTLAGARSVLRVFIPNTYTESGSIQSGSFEEQLDKIRVQAVHPDKATVHEYVDDGVTVGYFRYKDDSNTDQTEITYVNESGETVIKVLSQEGEYSADLGGRLSMFESKRPLFLTKQIREQNGVVNKAHTMLNGNLDNGFLERTYLNAQPPGKWEKDDNGQEKFVPDPIRVGAGTTNFITGVETEDEDGKRKISNASVVYREPITPQTFIESKAEAYASILEEARQKHALIAGDASPSGESRIQALGDYIESLNETKSEIDEAGLWMIETVSAIAYDLSGETTKMEQLRGEFSCRISTGPLPASLRTEIINQYKDGLLPREDAMAMLGVDDVDAAISRIDTGTEYATEILEIMDRINIKPPTLVKKLFKVIREDQEILSDLEQSEIASIESEIDEILNRNAQETDIFGAVN